MFRKIQQYVGKMVEMFKRSRFFLSVAQKMSYDEGFTFNESNIIHYLAELEEYISSLITYSAFKRDDPNAAISAIPLEKLNQKDFNRKDLTVNSSQIPYHYIIDWPSNGLWIEPGPSTSHWRTRHY